MDTQNIRKQIVEPRTKKCRKSRNESERESLCGDEFQTLEKKHVANRTTITGTRVLRVRKLKEKNIIYIYVYNK